MKTTLLIVASVILATCVSGAQGQTRGTRPLMAPADTLRVATVSDAQISPDGQFVVYTVATVSGNETVNSIWLTRVSPHLAHQPTNTPPPTSLENRIADMLDWPGVTNTSTLLIGSDWKASNPRWSPDNSKIAFLAGREGQRELRFVTLGKREPQLIATLPSTNFFITYAGEPFAWAPDSKRIAYISATEEPSRSIDASARREEDNDPRVVERLRYKSRTSFSDNRRTHVWITAIERPEPRQLTSGAFYDHALSFHPSGDQIAFLSNREPDPDANNNSDIFTVDLHG